MSFPHISMSSDSAQSPTVFSLPAGSYQAIKSPEFATAKYLHLFLCYEFFFCYEFFHMQTKPKSLKASSSDLKFETQGFYY